VANVSPKPPEPSKDPLRECVERFERRRGLRRGAGAHTLAVAVTVAGIGWAVVVPAVAGFLLGHMLDARFGTGIALSAGLGILGLGLGCYVAWRRIARE